MDGGGGCDVVDNGVGTDSPMRVDRDQMCVHKRDTFLICTNVQIYIAH